MTQFPSLKSSHFCVCNSDNLYSSKALYSVRTTTFSNAFISYDKNYLNFSIKKINSFSILKLNSNGFLEDILEKPELKDYESKILSAQNDISIIENKIYSKLVATIAEKTLFLQKNAQIISRLDCLLSFSKIANKFNYCKTF